MKRDSINKYTININPSVLRVIAIYVISLIRYYWKIFIGYVLEQSGYIKIVDLQTKGKCIIFNSLFSNNTLHTKNPDSEYRYYGVTTYLQNIEHHILMYCRSSDILRNIREIPMGVDCKNSSILDRTIYSDVMQVAAKFNDVAWTDDDLKGWNSNLCVLRTNTEDEIITKDQWVRVGVYRYLTSRGDENAQNIRINELKIDTMTLDDMIAF